MAIATRQRSTGFLNIPNRPKFSKEIEELFRSNVIAMNRLASGCAALDSIRGVAIDGGVPQVLYEQSAIRNWSAKALLCLFSVIQARRAGLSVGDSGTTRLAARPRLARKPEKLTD